LGGGRETGLTGLKKSSICVDWRALPLPFHVVFVGTFSRVGSSFGMTGGSSMGSLRRVHIRYPYTKLRRNLFGPHSKSSFARRARVSGSGGFH
jgi:hypothetical protein